MTNSLSPKLEKAIRELVEKLESTIGGPDEPIFINQPPGQTLKDYALEIRAKAQAVKEALEE